MKQFRMPDRKEPPKTPGPKSSPSDSAFDRWLNRGLHELFDDVMKEAVPPEMLKLLKPDKSGGENEIETKKVDPTKNQQASDIGANAPKNAEVPKSQKKEDDPKK